MVYKLVSNNLREVSKKGYSSQFIIFLEIKNFLWKGVVLTYDIMDH